jgi:glutamate racemase
MDDRPIGVFDSGFGGLTVARALIDLLPNEQIVYVGDTARYPYGPRPAGEVSRFANEIVHHLVDVEDVKMIVVACNTAAAVALDELRFDFDVPITGVVEPGLHAAATVTRNGRIGVIGTVGTIASGAYQRAAAELRISSEVHCLACPGFVEFVERGELDSDQVHVLAERLLAPLVEIGIDTLLLGCTHYPFLARTIADAVGRSTVLVSSAEETAFEVRGILSSTGLGRRSPPKVGHRFLSSGDSAWFAEMGRRLLGPELAIAEPVVFVPTN